MRAQVCWTTCRVPRGRGPPPAPAGMGLTLALPALGACVVPGRARPLPAAPCRRASCRAVWVFSSALGPASGTGRDTWGSFWQEGWGPTGALSAIQSPAGVSSGPGDLKGSPPPPSPPPGPPRGTAALGPPQQQPFLRCPPGHLLSALAPCENQNSCLRPQREWPRPPVPPTPTE